MAQARSAIQRLTSSKQSALESVPSLLAAGLHDTADKICNCSSIPTISTCTQGHNRVKIAFRCKQRLCLICQKRISVRIAREMTSAVESLQQGYPGLQLFFFTFTTPICGVEDVTDRLSRMNKAYGRLLRRRKLADFLLGSFKGAHFECHPDEGQVNMHLHSLLAFKSSYRSRGYIRQTQWLELWRESFRDHSITQVDVLPVLPDDNHPTLAGVAGHVAGYAVTSINLKQAPPGFLRTLHDSLRGRRLYSFSGQLDKARPKKLPAYKSDDVCPTCSAELSESIYQWNHRTRDYVERSHSNAGQWAAI